MLGRSGQLTKLLFKMADLSTTKRCPGHWQSLLSWSKPIAQANKPLPSDQCCYNAPHSGGLCYMATEKLRDMELSRSHCPRGGLAGLTPPLSSPKPALFLLKLDASQMFLFCPYVRAISMSLVPKRDGNRKPWPTNQSRRGYMVPEDWGSRPGRVPQWDFQASYFLKGESPPAHHSLPGHRTESLWRSKERPGKRKHLCPAEATQMKRSWTLLCKLSRKYSNSIQIFGSAINFSSSYDLLFNCENLN